MRACQSRNLELFTCCRALFTRSFKFLKFCLYIDPLGGLHNKGNEVLTNVQYSVYVSGGHWILWVQAGLLGHEAFD